MKYRGFWMATGWFMVATIIWLSVMPSPPDPGIEHADKIEHVLAYGMLMFWFCQLHAGWRTRLAYAIGFAAMGIALEVAQSALAYRTYEEVDMVANGLGVAAGWMVAQASGTQVFARIERLIGV